MSRESTAHADRVARQLAMAVHHESDSDRLSIDDIDETQAFRCHNPDYDDTWYLVPADGTGEDLPTRYHESLGCVGQAVSREMAEQSINSSNVTVEIVDREEIEQVDTDTDTEGLVTDGGSETVTHANASETIEYWVRVIGSNHNRKALHFPALHSTRSDPQPLCDTRPQSGEWRDVDLEVFPQNHVEDLVCEECLSRANGEMPAGYRSGAGNYIEASTSGDVDDLLTDGGDHTTKVSLRVPTPILKEMEALANRGLFKTRSDAMRCGMRRIAERYGDIGGDITQR